MSSNNNLIRLENLKKVYKVGETQVNALRGVSYTIKEGDMVAIMGPSGSGKSTLMNIIGCLDTASAGTYILNGVNVSKMHDADLAYIRNREIGFVFQTFNLLPVYTVFENVELPLLLLGLPAAERRKKVMDALDWVHLADRAKSKPAELSGGQSQRVAIARAVVKGPELVLADEPTANLDSKSAARLMDIMAQLNREEQITFLFSTHDPRVIRKARRVITLVDGQVASDQAQVPESSA